MATTYTTPETNLINNAALTNAQAREAEFVAMFTDGIKKLTEAIGVTRPIAKAAGTVLRAYKAKGSLTRGDNVAEGDIIPLSKYEVESVDMGTLKLNKWRKATSAEAILDKGYDLAVELTTDKMLAQVQRSIRTNLFAALTNATAATVVKGKGFTFQKKLAQAWGNLQKLYEDVDDVEPIYFVNPMDIADYLGTANITTQNAFGMTYVQDFMGLGTVISNSDIPAGVVVATAKNNIVSYYAQVNGAGLGDAFAFTTDETGYVGIHEAPNYTNMTSEDVVVCGVVFFAERADGVIIVNDEQA